MGDRGARSSRERVTFGIRKIAKTTKEDHDENSVSTVENWAGDHKSDAQIY